MNNPGGGGGEAPQAICLSPAIENSPWNPSATQFSPSQCMAGVGGGGGGRDWIVLW